MMNVANAAMIMLRRLARLDRMRGRGSSAGGRRPGPGPSITSGGGPGGPPGPAGRPGTTGATGAAARTVARPTLARPTDARPAEPEPAGFTGPAPEPRPKAPPCRGSPTEARPAAERVVGPPRGRRELHHPSRTEVVVRNCGASPGPARHRGASCITAPVFVRNCGA